MPTVSIPEMNREVFETVVKSIYTDPQKASIREIIANAVDANHEVKSSAPNKVIVTFDHDSVIVRDFGTGMSPDTIRDIYGSMYQSTKRSLYKDGITVSNGEHGIGSKAPYGYLYSIENASSPPHAQYYIVRTINNGIEYTYTMFLSVEGIPSYELLRELPTDENSGTEVVLPFSYKLNESNTMDVRKLVGTIIPFYHPDFGRLIEITGNNTSVINAINKACDETCKFGRTYFVDYSSLYGAHGSAHDSDTSIKYKNIVYPLDTGSFISELSRRYSSNINVFYDININNLTKPLLANRSRDRIDWTDDQKNVIEDMVDSDTTKLNETIHDVFQAIINNNSTQSIAKFNAILKTVASVVNSSSMSSGTLVDILSSLTSKKLIRKSVLKQLTESVPLGERELIIWRELFGISVSELEKIAKSLNIDVCFIEMYLENFRYNNFVSPAMFAPKDSVALDELNIASSTGRLKHVMFCGNNAEVYSDISQMTISSSNSYNTRNLPYEIANPNVAFIIRDTKGYKFEIAAYMGATEHVYTVYMIDPPTHGNGNHILEAFKTDGITQIYKTSTLSERYRTEISNLKKMNHKTTGTGIKRVKGVINAIERCDRERDEIIKDASRRTVPSDVLENISTRIGDVYVLRESESFRVSFTVDGSMVSCTYNVADDPDYMTRTNMELSSNTASLTLEIDDMAYLMPVNSLLLVVKDNEYDNIMEYFIDNDVYSFSDRVHDFLESLNLNIFATPNKDDVTLEMNNICDSLVEQVKRNREYDIKDNILDTKLSSGRAALVLFDLATSAYNFRDFGHPFDTLRTQMTRVEFRILERFCNYNKSNEVTELVNNLLTPLENSNIARTILRNINKYSLRYEEEDFKEFVDYIFSILGCEKYKEMYLTDTK